MKLVSICSANILEIFGIKLMKTFLIEVVDINTIDKETGEIIETRKYPVSEDKYGKYYEIYFEDIGMQKIYITNAKYEVC